MRKPKKFIYHVGLQKQQFLYESTVYASIVLRTHKNMRQTRYTPLAVAGLHRRTLHRGHRYCVFEFCVVGKIVTPAMKLHFGISVLTSFQLCYKESCPTDRVTMV